MKHRTAITAAVACAAAFAGTGALAASAKTSVLTIRHQVRGCHTWSFDGKTWAAAQRVTLARGSTLKVVDNDVMPHRLLQVAGSRSPSAEGQSATARAAKKIGTLAYTGCCSASSGEAAGSSTASSRKPAASSWLR